MAAETAEITVEALVKVGGREWQKAGRHRVYFQDCARWYGLEVNRYNTGNISSARLDGDTISNSHARQIDTRLSWAKVYYDVGLGQFQGQDIAQADLGRIVERIKAAVAQSG